MEHYIIIRVTEEAPSVFTKAGLLRRLIHRIALENDIKIADNLLREDRMCFPDGRPVPYEEAKALFKRVMGGN